MKVAENAYEIRTSKSLTLRDVADAAGLSVGAVHSVERPKASPRISTLEQLANGLGVQLSDLLDREAPHG